MLQIVGAFCGRADQKVDHPNTRCFVGGCGSLWLNESRTHRTDQPVKQICQGSVQNGRILRFCTAELFVARALSLSVSLSLLSLSLSLSLSHTHTHTDDAAPVFGMKHSAAGAGSHWTRRVLSLLHATTHPMRTMPILLQRCAPLSPHFTGSHPHGKYPPGSLCQCSPLENFSFPFSTQCPFS